MANQKKYLRWLGDYIGVQSASDWYFLRDTDIIVTNGAPLLAMYNGSVMEILRNVLPEENDWQPWCFVPTPRGLWEDKTNHRKYFDWIAREYNVKSMDDWYNIRLGDMRKYGAKLLEKYKDSLIVALQSVYPEHIFLPWRFNHTRKFIFEDKKYQREYLDWLGKELNITKPEDWYYVNPSDIVARYGTEFLDRYDSDLLKALQTVYPEHTWRLPTYAFPTELPWTGRLPNMAVVRLHDILVKFFPGDKIYMSHANDELLDPSTKNRIQFDVFIPRYSLAFDCHDETFYHFSGIFGPPDANQKRNELKVAMCERNGIALISVPYWIEERPNYNEFVGHLIKRKRPSQLLTLPPLSPGDISFLEMVPNHISIGTTFKKGKWTFGNALAQPDWWNDEDDPTDYWISEKLDGVRAFWDGQRMYNARGYPIATPEHFRSTFPEQPVEGELYAGPGSYDFVCETIRTGDMEKWKSIQFWVFDAPEQPQMTYEKRMRIVQYCTVPNKNLKTAESWRCTGKEHLDEIYQSVLSRGGEGVVLRKAKSHYFDPKVFFKKEPFKDAEFLVRRHQKDGPLECWRPDNSTTVVPAPEKDAPPPGAVISVKNESDLASLHFYRERPDLVWYEVRRKRWYQDVHYRIGYGLPAGLPKCRGCRTIFRDRNKPRVMADCLFYPPFSSPYPGQVAFCINVDCIRKGTISDRTGDSRDIFQYAHWDGRIGVPGEIWDYLKDELIQHKHIKWEMV
eukprot:Phypoly_transcript_03259.p1 GENE.Phypoly_transcript_03259~~Phypoly_transcript_03259.p1  ORF type:complete len:823 (+),score=78.04 Phypoly_transcript_03259:267-2471(+)